MAVNSPEKNTDLFSFNLESELKISKNTTFTFSEPKINIWINPRDEVTHFK